jgi:hypothetical protein
VKFVMDMYAPSRVEGDVFDAIVAAAWRTLEDLRRSHALAGLQFAERERQEKAAIRAAVDAARDEGYRGGVSDAKRGTV